MVENPFEVLRLDPATRAEEAVHLADRLLQEVSDEPTRLRLRQAAQQLSLSPDRAALAALLSPPGPGYASPILAEFIQQHGSPPAGSTAQAQPQLDEDEFRRRLLDAMAHTLEPGAAELEALPISETGSEIARQTAEAMWQALLSDLRA